MANENHSGRHRAVSCALLTGKRFGEKALRVRASYMYALHCVWSEESFSSELCVDDESLRLWNPRNR